MKVGTLYVGTMTDKVRELVEMMVKRMEDIGPTMCAGDTLEEEQGNEHRRWRQNILPWRRWEEKWSRSHTEGDYIGRVLQVTSVSDRMM